VITSLAFRLQDTHTLLKGLDEQIQAEQADAELEGEDREIDQQTFSDYNNISFVAGQLLEIALLADYGDEIGRRKMFTLVSKSHFRQYYVVNQQRGATVLTTYMQGT
jgi:condensin complex subunit 3